MDSSLVSRCLLFGIISFSNQVEMFRNLVQTFLPQAKLAKCARPIQFTQVTVEPYSISVSAHRFNPTLNPTFRIRWIWSIVCEEIRNNNLCIQ
jgi:hypothetical protein